MATIFNTYTKLEKKEELAEAKNGYYYQEDVVNVTAQGRYLHFTN